MIYLNVILTILCLILISFLVLGVSYAKKLTKNNPFKGQIPTNGDPKQIEESMKMINNLFKNIMKK